MPRKLDEKEKSSKNLKQQIQHTKERIGDAEFALDHGDLSEGRRKELEAKNKHRRDDIRGKKDELEEMTDD
ncbi:MAG TPA: hypothetical protein GX530_08815 [Corynebacteriales bacterium]|nr:hypothetical protein [Bacillota bacterium]HHY08599.1 hypothetical protein [Mycobacteriales bacterium]